MTPWEERIDTFVRLADQRQVNGTFELWEQSPDDTDKVRLCLSFLNRVICKEATNFFEALLLIRTDLEPEGTQIICYGCSLDVFPSEMILQMGPAYKAYRLQLGVTPQMSDLVDILEHGPDIVPVTIEEQQNYYNEWVSSIRRR